MMRRVHLSTDDLQMIIWACEHQAQGPRNDEKRHTNPVLENGAADIAVRAVGRARVRGFIPK